MTFDVIEYFQTIQDELILLQGINRFFRVSGIGHLEELMSNLRKVNYPIIAVDDSQDGYITEQGGGYMDSRYYSVFILAQVKLGNDDDRNIQMAACRTIFAKILSRMIRDSGEYPNELVWMHPDRIKYDEVGYLADNLFGIHFGFTVEIPEDLVYDTDDWTT
jgi:hypothetical protein